MASRWFEEKL